jgi:hypothetical protein
MPTADASVTNWGQTFDKLAQSLSLIFGVEAIIVLKDI